MITIPSGPSEITSRLDDVDASFHHLRGVLNALSFMSEDLNLIDRTPQVEAFWAMLSAGQAFVATGIVASNDAHRLVKCGFLCKGA